MCVPFPSLTPTITRFQTMLEDIMSTNISMKAPSGKGRGGGRQPCKKNRSCTLYTQENVTKLSSCALSLCLKKKKSHIRKDIM